MTLTTNGKLILEFEQYLKNSNIQFKSGKDEVIFNKIMPTKRQFRADYFIEQQKTIIEINGGQFVNGRHNRGGKGYEDDLMKSNLASLRGFKYFQFTYEMLARREYELFLTTQIEYSIINDLCIFSGNNILKNTRKREIAEPRQVAMFLIKINTMLSLQKIADIFGKDHATVLHAIKAVSDLIDTNAKFRAKYEKLFTKYDGSCCKTR